MNSVIGLYSPLPQSGKTTVAGLLANYLNGTRVSFADPMRRLVIEFVTPFMDGGVMEVWDWIRDDRKDTKPIPGLGVTLRHLLVTIGTDWGRQKVHPDVWVMQARERLRQERRFGPVIFDDVRFPNEYAMLRKEGALLIKVYRPDAPETGAPNEGQLAGLPFDDIITNVGTLDDLIEQVDLLAHDRFGARR